MHPSKTESNWELNILHTTTRRAQRTIESATMSTGRLNQALIKMTNVTSDTSPAAKVVKMLLKWCKINRKKSRRSERIQGKDGKILRDKMALIEGSHADTVAASRAQVEVWGNNATGTSRVWQLVMGQIGLAESWEFNNLFFEKAWGLSMYIAFHDPTFLVINPSTPYCCRDKYYGQQKRLGGCYQPVPSDG